MTDNQPPMRRLVSRETAEFTNAGECSLCKSKQSICLVCREDFKNGDDEIACIEAAGGGFMHVHEKCAEKKRL